MKRRISQLLIGIGFLILLGTEGASEIHSISDGTMWIQLALGGMICLIGFLGTRYWREF